MFGRRWRSRKEIAYLVKNDFKRALPRAMIMVWTLFIVLGAIVVKNTWNHDVPNWYATVIGIYFGVVISIAIYFKSQRSQRIIEEKLRKIEGIMNSQSPITKKSIRNSNFQIYFVLDSVIDTYAEIEKIAKKWKKAKGDYKKFLQEKIQYVWENSITEYSKIRDNDEIISTKLYEPHHIEKIRKISEKCKITLQFDDKHNKIKPDDFHHTVVDCILLLEDMKLDSQYREQIFRY